MNSIVGTQLEAPSIEEIDCLHIADKGSLLGEVLIDELASISSDPSPASMHKALKERMSLPWEGSKKGTDHSGDLTLDFPSLQRSHLRELSHKLGTVSLPSSKRVLASRVLEIISQSVQQLGNRLPANTSADEDEDEDDLQDSIHLAKARLLMTDHRRKRTLNKLENVVGAMETAANAELHQNSYRAMAA